MKSLVEYINEAKSPVFTNDINGINEFCKYVANDGSEWVVNSDKTITVTPQNSNSTLVNVDLKDLKEIPNFIVFSGMENVGLEFYNCTKLENLKLRVKGDLMRLVITECKKMKTLDISDVKITHDLMIEKNTKLESIIGPKANSQLEKISIRINKSLKKLDLTGIKEWAHYNSINKNGTYKVDRKKMPKKQADNVNLNLDE